MSELVFIKLGGSVITDKQADEVANIDVIGRLAREIAAALAVRPDLRVVLGHGSGSFGHVYAARYSVRDGCYDEHGRRDMTGYVLTGAAAGRLNRVMTDALVESGVPAVSVQPSALLNCVDGAVQHMDTRVIEQLLAQGCVPLVYGDVALDSVRGCTIASTEMIFEYLAPRLHPARMLMVGQVDGVYTGDPTLDPTARRIACISPDRYDKVRGWLSASNATDVTGGMLSKVESLLRLVTDLDGLSVRLFSGVIPRQLEVALIDSDYAAGTLVARQDKG